MTTAFLHVWRVTRKPHRARGRPRYRQRLCLALMAQMVSARVFVPAWAFRAMLKVLQTHRGLQ